MHPIRHLVAYIVPLIVHLSEVREKEPGTMSNRATVSDVVLACNRAMQKTTGTLQITKLVRIGYSKMKAAESSTGEEAKVT